ncbi:hypothetical protein SAMN02982917_4121 [Azospirillum oryzae]|uniref:Phage tail tube protein n=1 Tax=Azospirillum oryzae TaxID=286727 RepID=A0A1X7GPF9_9PROT|nr:hypothetical protein [Azospirillum oryzae]SMF72267.1 hypothetical protein SAMN02982917_4121 [Azospirillum oryzae]
MSGNAVQSAGTRYFIATGSDATNKCSTAAEYAALTWVEVEEVEDFGAFGEQYEKVTYKTLGDGAVHKKKGTVDYGSATVKLARVPTGTGQAAVKLAAKNRKTAYNHKIEFDDAPDAGTPTTIYLNAFVMGYTTEIGGNDKVIEASVGLEIDAEPIEVAAAVTP